MSQLKIVAVNDIPREVTSCPTDNLISLYKTCLEMADLCVREHGIGLAAVQVGIPLQLYLVRYGPDARYFLNCTYRPIGDDLTESVEGCLSLRNEDGSLRHFKVSRHKRVRVQGKELDGTSLKVQDIDMELDGLYSIVHQHEIDHCQGILLTDPGKSTEIYIW